MLLALAYSGCFENNENHNPTQDLLFNKIKNNVIDFVKNVSSYKYIKTGGIKNFLIKGSSTELSDIVSNTTFKADIKNQSLELITNYTDIGLKLDYILSIYIKDNYKYTGRNETGNFTWEIDELTPSSLASNWIFLSLLEQYADQMTNEIPQKDKNINWKRLEDENLDNETYYALQREHIFNNTIPGEEGYTLVKLYHTFLINKTNYKIYKVKFDQMQDNFGIYAGEYDRVYVIGQDIYTFYDYNIPVNVKIPPEIKR